MRAALNIHDDLVAEVQKFSGEASKTRAIVTAMEEYPPASILRRNELLS